jgi:hypothetical protein
MTLPYPVRSLMSEGGMNQEDQVRWMRNVQALINELRADHATSRTLTEELIADHATFKTVVDELITDHATMVTLLTDLKSMANYLRYNLLYRVEGIYQAVFAIDTNFDVKNTEVITYLHNGILQTLADNTSCNTGTAKTIAADQWAAMLISGTGAAALVGTWTADAASEAAALALAKAAALADTTNTPLGVVAVQTASGQPWIAGTDALQTGTGGNVSADTNYYDYATAVQAAISSSPPATLSAATPATLSAASPATLSNNDDIAGLA